MPFGWRTGIAVISCFVRQGMPFVAYGYCFDQVPQRYLHDQMIAA